MLRVLNVFKSYKNKQVLKGVNLEVLDGEVKGLIGINGAGKSTLIENICGVKPFDGGEIFVGDCNVNDRKSIRKIKSLIGYMPQSFSLFNDLTVKENLEYLCTIYGINKSKVEEISSLCYLNDFYNTLACNLSGGYKQLLSIASCIISDPKFLILDEPTSAMDPLFRKKFWKIINKCKEEGKTVLVITHYMEELSECDSFACLANGKITFDGKLSDLKKDKNLNIEEILNNCSFLGEENEENN